MINWYNEVSRNLDKIPDCVAYFDKELLEARKQWVGEKLDMIMAEFKETAPTEIDEPEVEEITKTTKKAKPIETEEE